MSVKRRGAPTPGHPMGRPIHGALLDDLTNRIDVVPRSGKGCHYVLPLRPGREHDLDWQKALCGARPRTGWSTAVPEDAQFCISCQQQLDVEAEVAEARVWAAVGLGATLARFDLALQAYGQAKREMTR